MSKNGKPKRQKVKSLDPSVLPELPENWTWARLVDLAADEPNAITDGPFGSNLKTSHYTSNGPRVIRLQNIGDGNFIDEIAHISREHFESLQRHHIHAGDLAIAALGETLPRSCVIPSWVGPALVKADCPRFKPQKSLVEAEYVNLALNSSELRSRTSAIIHGVGRPRLNLTEIRGIWIPVAPPNEQRRIVAKIEELFSDLDAGVAALERAKSNLKRYRAAVLKAAVEGKLTEQWRTENPYVEPASELLERIRAERREHWEAEQLAKYEAKGKKPPKGWKDKYKEPAEPDVDGLPELPEGWLWIKSDALCTFVTSGSRGWAKYYSDEGSAFLRVGNLDHLSIRLDLNQIQRVTPPEGPEKIRTRVQPGDILVSVTADVGMVGVVPPQFEEAFTNQHVAIMRTVSEVHPPYVAWYLASDHGGNRQFRELQRGATKQGLGLDDIRNVDIPLPPLAEQIRIAEAVDKHFSVAEAVEATTNLSAVRSFRLRQSILKRAFEGKLVPQDANDEPASKLLARIKAERAAAEANGKKTTKRKRKTAKTK